MQRSFVVKKWPRWCTEGKILIPAQVVDGLNLIWHSDLVVSGGGTMNREAAALGVPVYSIFRGKIGAVDKYLADNRRLTLLESIDDVYTKIALIKRHRSAKLEHTNPAALQSIVGNIIAILEEIP
jgi:predicted glycosyltransferase